MKSDQNLSETLLHTWEETYKKGQLTLWIFLALSDGNKYVGEIQAFIHTTTENTIRCEDQSLYRALRKFEQVKMVGFSHGRGNSGPDRKYYYITPMGKEILSAFIKRNIQLFFKPAIRKLLTEPDQ